MRFRPIDGIYLDDRNNIIVDDNPLKVSFDWYGEADGTYVFMTVRLGYTSALVYGRDTRYTLDGIAPRTAILRDLDPSIVDQGRCGADLLEPEASGKHALLSSRNPKVLPGTDQLVGMSSKYMPELTVLFYYTDAVLANYGNDVNAIATAADALVTQLNDSLDNTVHTDHVLVSRLGAPLHLGTYVEAGVPPQSNPGVRWNNHHKELKARDVNQADPNLPAREDVGADFAILLVMDKGEPGAPIYGVAYTQHTDCAGVTNCDIGSAGYRDFAYAVVSIHPDAQNLTFAHEIGHMLGNQHDPPPPPVPTAAFAYSYGHRTASERDIMADPPCIDAVCPLRLPQFSNPSVFFAGTTTPSGVAGARDVAKTIYATIGGSTNIYPIAGEDPIHVFWDGFEH